MTLGSKRGLTNKNLFLSSLNHYYSRDWILEKNDKNYISKKIRLEMSLDLF